MYASGMFTETKLREYKNKIETDKTWLNAKVSFDALYTNKYMYQDDMGATKSGPGSVNSFDELKSPRQSYNWRSLKGSSIHTMPSLYSGGWGVKTRDEAWTAYVDTLKDLLSESKEIVASVTLAQDTLMNKLKEQHKQTAAAMEKDTKRIAMLE